MFHAVNNVLVMSEVGQGMWGGGGGDGVKMFVKCTLYKFNII